LNADPSTARAFTRIVAHLDLDGARVAARPALREHEEREFVEQRLEAARQDTGRRQPGRVPEAAQGEERVPIAQAQRRDGGARWWTRTARTRSVAGSVRCAVRVP